ncbi:Glucosylceramidase [Araneus ventricosus]|uniref:Glucosylceramidase n=1 Tax=Araneus ventricosus TaxID=182803 RepID=A0A4Y2CCX1_ARAVE|nr:Glucosylceramidase [Araneus ventricosus]
MVSNKFICQFFIFVLFYAGCECSPCKPRAYGDHNIVCVCDDSYCDELELISDVASNQAARYETNKSGARFQSSVLNFSKNADPGIPVLSVNRSEMYQFILGFGGAFTDATGINIKSMTPQLQKKIMSSYFSKTGNSMT